MIGQVIPDVPWIAYPVRTVTKVEVGIPKFDWDEHGYPWIPLDYWKMVKVLKPGWFDEGAGI